MSFHVCKCHRNDKDEYHIRYPGLTLDEAQEVADRINSGFRQSSPPPTLNIYRISARSRHGTRFATYLQSVTVVAESAQAALDIALAQHGDDFIPEAKVDLSSVEYIGTYSRGVIDYHYASDY